MAFAGPRSAVGSASDLSVRGSGFDTRSGHRHSCLLPLIQEGLLSVVHDVLVNRLGGLSLPRKRVIRFTDRPNMTIAVFFLNVKQQQWPFHRGA